MPQPMLLGELLVSKGLITPTQLQAALESQRTTKEFLGALLVRRGWLKEVALLQTLAEQFEMPYITLAQETIDWQVAQRFSLALMMEHHCLPLRMTTKTVRVAIANPLDAWAISELEKAANPRRVELCLASASDILAAIQQFQQQAIKPTHRA